MADDKTFTQADIDAAIEKAVGPLKDSIGKLESKNEELIGENRKLKRGTEIKPEDLAAAEDRADKAEAALKDAQKLAKDATSAKEKAEAALKVEQGVTHKLIAENGLVDALTKAGVSDPAYLEAAKAMNFGQVKVVADGDTRKAMFGDKPLDEAIKEWAASDVGKKFVAAPANGGGGASGGDKSKTASAKTMTRSAYDALDQMSKAELGPEMAKGELKIVDETA